MVMVRSIIIPRISKRWSNPHNILDRKDSNTSRQNTTLAGEQVVFIMWTSRGERKSRVLSMIIKIIEGKEGISHHEHS